MKTNNLGVGANQPGEVTPEDDIYDQYKKRMMLGYKYRPNPLVCAFITSIIELFMVGNFSFLFSLVIYAAKCSIISFNPVCMKGN